MKYDPSQSANREELMEELRQLLPPEIANLTPEQQDKYLESALEAYQRDEMMEHDTRDKVARFVERATLFPRKHPEVYQFSPSFLHPDFREALASGSFESVITEVSPRLYALPFFTLEFCELLLDEARAFEEWAVQQGLDIQRPNSMNKHGLILDQVGFEPFLDSLMNTVVSPLSAELFSDCGGASLDTHHGFIVEYGPQKDKKLDFHVDDSEITLNVCLGTQFTGGDLYFRGVRCQRHQQTPPHSSEEVDYAHSIGTALLHAGRHRHGAKPITSGARSNLILWCRSTEFRREIDYRLCAEWCGWEL